MKKKIIQDVGEEPLVLHSDVRRPLKDLSFPSACAGDGRAGDDRLQRRGRGAASRRPRSAFPKRNSSTTTGRRPIDSATSTMSSWPAAARSRPSGTTFRADANAVMSVVGTLGNVHSGFNREVDDLWPLLEDLLRDNPQPVWFCGHSLGAAMATICAYRCKTGVDRHQSAGAAHVRLAHASAASATSPTPLAHYRWVHNNDIVTRVPPVWMGYRHCGNEIYLDRYGRIRKLTGICCAAAIAGAVSRRACCTGVSTCSPITAFTSTWSTSCGPCEEEERSMNRGREAVDEDDLVIRHESDDMAA